MKEIKLIFMNEFVYFFKRKHMIKWLLIVILMTLAYPFISTVPGLDIKINQHEFCLFAIFFVSGFTPINMSLDAFVSEKIHKTIETLMSTPLKLSNIFIGKMLFGILITLSIFVIMFVCNSIILYLNSSVGFLGYFGITKLLLIFLIVILTHILIYLITSIGGVSTSNYKILGYLVTLLDVMITAMLIYANNQNKLDMYIYLLFLLLFLDLIFIYFIHKNLSKSLVIKYMR